MADSFYWTVNSRNTDFNNTASSFVSLAPYLITSEGGNYRWTVSLLEVSFSSKIANVTSDMYMLHTIGGMPGTLAIPDPGFFSTADDTASMMNAAIKKAGFEDHCGFSTNNARIELSITDGTLYLSDRLSSFLGFNKNTFSANTTGSHIFDPLVHIRFISLSSDFIDPTGGDISSDEFRKLLPPIEKHFIQRMKTMQRHHLKSNFFYRMDFSLRDASGSRVEFIQQSNASTNLLLKFERA